MPDDAVEAALHLNRGVGPRALEPRALEPRALSAERKSGRDWSGSAGWDGSGTGRWRRGRRRRRTWRGREAGGTGRSRARCGVTGRSAWGLSRSVRRWRKASEGSQERGHRGLAAAPGGKLVPTVQGGTSAIAARQGGKMRREVISGAGGAGQMPESAGRSIREAGWTFI